MSIPVGTKGRADCLVTEDKTAAAAGSGTLPVYATPWMAALMEQAAQTSLQPYLTEEESSVGTHLSIDHLSATPVGMKVWAESEVTAVDGRKVCLNVAAYDEAGLIGKGTHERFIIAKDRFLTKAQAKKGG